MAPKPSEKHLRLFNVIMQYDVYVVARTFEEALEAVRGTIQQGEAPTEQISHEVRTQRDIRTEWKTERPFVAGAISDEEWAPFAGKTTEEFFEAVSLPVLPSKN